MKRIKEIIADKNFAFFIFTFGIFLILIAPNLLSEGMFMDGLLYAAISHNLANGYGTFWNPVLSDTFISEFHGHPPLAIGIQSIFFRIFGDSVYIEKFYSLLTIVVVGYFMILLWKESGKNRKSAWIPLFLWIMIPLISWSATNNMLENTMSIFVILAVWLYMVHIRKHNYLLILLSGLALLSGFYTKGFTALFPFALPFIYWIVKRNHGFKKMVLETCMMTIGFLIPLLLLILLSPVALESTILYLETQVIGSLQNVVTVNSRLFILYKFLMEALILLIIALIVVLYGIRNKIYKDKKNGDFQWFWIFLFLSLAGIIPIMISLKQRGFYMLSALPFFAIAIGFIIEPVINRWLAILSHKGSRILKIASLIVLASAITLNLTFIGKTNRDHELLHDIHLMLPLIPEHSLVAMQPELWDDWSLYGYFARYKFISLDAKRNDTEFLILQDPEKIHHYSSDYDPVDLNTKSFFLFKSDKLFQ